MDAFHDALTDKLHEELKKRKIDIILCCFYIFLTILLISLVIAILFLF